MTLASLSPELALVAVDSGVVLLRGSNVVSTINLGFTVTASVLAPDGSEAIIGGQDGKLHIYSIDGDLLTEEATLEKHRGAISVIRYSPDLSMFASGDLNREAIVWDRASREVTYHLPKVLALDFLHDLARFVDLNCFIFDCLKVWVVEWKTRYKVVFSYSSISLLITCR